MKRRLLFINFLGITKRSFYQTEIPGVKALRCVGLFFFGWLVGWFLNVLVNYQVISRMGLKTERLTHMR